MKVLVALVFLSAACGELKLFNHKNYVLTSSTAFGSPVDSEQSIEVDPLFLFNPERDVRILLQTRRNQRNPQHLLFRNIQSVTLSHFDRTKPTRILVHGWFEDETSDINVDTAAELLDYNDFNVKQLII